MRGRRDAVHVGTLEALGRVLGICPTGGPHEVAQLFDVPDAEAPGGTCDLLQSLAATAVDYDDIDEATVAIREQYGVETALEVAFIAAACAWSIADQVFPDEEESESSIATDKPPVAEFLGQISPVQGRGLRYALAATSFGELSFCWPLQEGGSAGWEESVDENIARLLDHVLEHCPTGGTEELDATMCLCPGTNHPTLVSLAVFAVHADRQEDIEDAVRAKYGSVTALETGLKEIMQSVSIPLDLLRLADKRKKREERKSEDGKKSVMHLHNQSWDAPGPLCNQTKGKYASRISESERWCYRCRDLVDIFQNALQQEPMPE